ncbi:MAG: GNAT family N-acetyltransferase [Anaerolineaceae bacterium]|jgi:GNAT superfamily N-acetyltransferase|nr:GNAT family N-acetyltransferase [Anaerolineaceae bacterium]
MTPILREARKEDVPLLVKSRLDFLQALGYDLESQDKPHASQQIETFLSERLERDIFAWIALDNKTLMAVGFLHMIEVMWQPMAPNGRYGRIINILTWPPYRHQGLARAIMVELISKARELDLAYVELDASPEGQPLYESLGFVLTHAHHPPMRLQLK